MTYCMYFIQTLIIRCTVSEILAEIAHKGPNCLKITFRVIPYFSYLGQDWFHNKEATICNKFGKHFVTTE